MTATPRNNGNVSDFHVYVQYLVLTKSMYISLRCSLKLCCGFIAICCSLVASFAPTVSAHARCLFREADGFGVYSAL